MDPVTLLAAATAAYEGVKKAVELGREVTDIYGQLSTWAGHVGDLRDVLEEQKREEENPSIWKKISFDKSDTAVAFDRYAMEVKLKEMEDEIFHMFMYGDLCHLGIDGYRRFKQLRNEERDRRRHMIENQIRAKKRFLQNLLTYTVLVSAVAVAIGVVWWATDLIITHGAK